MSKRPNSDQSSPTPRRRRRNSATSTAPTPTPVPATARPSFWQRLRPDILSSWGLSTTFRVYIFLGGIAMVMAVLLYNEKMISDVKDQERNQVHLYAKLIQFAVSHMASDAQAAFIFQEIIHNPQIEFPLIFTDHRGKIISYKVAGLPAESDTSRQARRLRQETLAETLAEMDAINEPISVTLYPQASGYAHMDNQGYVIGDAEGYPLVWGGPGLPASDDTAGTAVAQAQLFLDKTPAQRFTVPAEGFSYVHFTAGALVVTDPEGKPAFWEGPDLPALDDTTRAAAATVQSLIQTMGTDALPLSIPTHQYIHYGDSALVSRVSLALFIQIGAIALFALIGFAGFRNIRRSEQRSIWVGMAKETAHQLGTPLSSLAGWLELMHSAAAARPNAPLAEITPTVTEMEQDMRRLNQIASRFSQIGSVPELVPGDIGEILAETTAYFQSRSPQFGRHDIRLERTPTPPVPLNAELIGWAFENLFKNAIDAIGRRQGSITVHVAPLPEGDAVQVTFTDNGGGIAPEHLNRVFQPGFSTKKRGWGLGLAFVKRIIAEYHNGRISVMQSAPGEGTTFEIILPLA
jgi:signal transduction histidine kinase